MGVHLLSLTHLEVLENETQLSLLLFNVVIEVLNKLILRAREMDLFRGLKEGEGELTEEVSKPSIMILTEFFEKKIVRERTERKQRSKDRKRI